MAGRVVGFVATFVIPIILVRIFDRPEFGTYKQLFLIYGTVLAFAQLGMTESLYYFIPGAAKRAADYVLNTLVVLTASGIVCFALLWWNAARIAAWFNNPALGQYIPYIAAFLLFMQVSMLLETVMIARKQHTYAFWTYALSSIIQALLLVIPVLIFRSLQALLAGAVAFSVLRFLVTLAYLAREFPEKPRFEFARWKAHLAYAMPFSLAVVLQVVQDKVHLYAVSIYFGAATFAVYAVGCLEVPLVGFLMASTSNVMMVKMKENISKGRDADALALWRDTVRKLVLVFTPLVGALIVTAHALIVTFYTAKYAASVPIFEIWSAAIILPALLTNSIMRVYAQVRFLIVLKLIKLGVVFLAITFLMPLLGLVGAVASAVIAMLAAEIVALYRIKAVMHCTMRRLLPWRDFVLIMAIAAVSALPALAARLLTHLPSIAELFLIPALYLGAYLALLWRYGPILPTEKQAVVHSAHRLATRCMMPWSA